MARLRLSTLVLTVACLGQAGFWYASHDLGPRLDILPELPSDQAVRAVAFGDNQFVFRLFGLHLQNAGDSTGHFTPLADYDYGRLSRWFDLEDRLDPVSDYVPAIAGYYYGLTPRLVDVRPVVTYLSRHAARDPAHKWRWLARATYLANHRLKDQALALQVARQLASVNGPDVPPWTRQMPAFILRQMGDKEAARAVLDALLATDPNLPEQEKEFMRRYEDRFLR